MEKHRTGRGACKSGANATLKMLRLRTHSMRTLCIFLLLCLATLARVHAQGGPPFITDDPGTPGNRHWEINVGWLGSHNPAWGNYQLPDLDINYGWGDRVQLKYEIPLAVSEDANHTTIAGLGDSFPGVKNPAL